MEKRFTDPTCSHQSPCAHGRVCDDDRFWTLISRLGPALQVSRLDMALSALTWWEAYDFTWQLHRAAHVLDTPLHRLHACSAYEHDTSLMPTDPAHGSGARATGEGSPLLAEFDDLTATVVALGREAWAAVVLTPALLASSWPTALGRQLLASANRALTSSVNTVVDARIRRWTPPQVA